MRQRPLERAGESEPLDERREVDLGRVLVAQGEPEVPLLAVRLELAEELLG